MLFSLAYCPRLEDYGMIKRRAFLGGTLSAAIVAKAEAQPATAVAQSAVDLTLSGPLVWPVVTKVQPDLRSFAGHTDTVPDIVGRIGTPPSLVIFTEGNHLMVLLGEDIVGAFPSWAKSHPQYADLDVDNIVVATLPQPVVVQMLRTGGIALGNLTLDVSRKSGFFPDIVMAGPDPLREVRKLGVIEPQARFFSRNRGPALLVRKGNRIETMKGPAESGQICSVGRRKIAKKIAKNKRCYANTLRPRSRMLLKVMKGG
jgi:hypothetical protein